MFHRFKQSIATVLRMSSLLILWLFAMPGSAFAYGIDDMVGNKWRVGTFLFLVFGMALYALFVVLYMRRGHGKVKKGEYILLWCILGGVLLGFVVSFIQFVEGFLL